MSGGDAKRSVRVAGAIQEELAQLLLTGEVHDPGVAGAMISRVELTDDLHYARVYVRLVELDPPPARRRGVIRGLERAAGFLRRTVGRRLRLRHAPELRFVWDEGVDHSLRVEAILDEIHREGGGAGPEVASGEDPTDR